MARKLSLKLLAHSAVRARLRMTCRNTGRHRPASALAGGTISPCGWLPGFGRRSGGGRRRTWAISSEQPIRQTRSTDSGQAGGGQIRRAGLSLEFNLSTQSGVARIPGHHLEPKFGRTTNRIDHGFPARIRKCFRGKSNIKSIRLRGESAGVCLCLIIRGHPWVQRCFPRRVRIGVLA